MKLAKDLLSKPISQILALNSCRSMPVRLGSSSQQFRPEQPAQRFIGAVSQLFADFSEYDPIKQDLTKFPWLKPMRLCDLAENRSLPPRAQHEKGLLKRKNRGRWSAKETCSHRFGQADFLGALRIIILGRNSGSVLTGSIAQCTGWQVVSGKRFCCNHLPTWSSKFFRSRTGSIRICLHLPGHPKMDLTYG